MKINWIKGVWSKARHNAFTDLCAFQGRLLCSFREGENHISPDGVIRVIELDFDGIVVNNCVVRMPSCDLRDPKLSIMPDGKMLLIAYGRHYDDEGTFLFSQPYSWFSCDGYSWSNAKAFGDKNWWLWRVRWHNKEAWGFAYNRRQASLNLYKGNPRRRFELQQSEALSLNKHGLGYPNESDLVFTKAGNALALVRRDADTCSAQLGYAKPPFRRWSWKSLPAYIGGPVMQPVNDDVMLISGRLWNKNGPKTAVWTYDLTSKEIELKLVLPSGGDCSYPGLHIEKDKVYLSYYSSHIEGKSNIYLAKIDLK